MTSVGVEDLANSLANPDFEIPVNFYGRKMRLPCRMQAAQITHGSLGELDYVFVRIDRV